jgi:anti-anti-sigma regulatory factor
LNAVLNQVAEVGGNVATWQAAISALRRHVLPRTDDGGAPYQIENLWQQARVMIGEVAQRVQAYDALQTQRQTYTLQQVGQALTATYDMERLREVITYDLPRLGIPSCYLSLYEGEEMPPATSRLVLAYDENGPIELGSDGRRFATHRLAPDGVLPHERDEQTRRPCCLAVGPLYFNEEQLGLVLFETESREGTVYEALRGHLSSALKGALLFLERWQAEHALEEAYAEVEKKVKERTAELERETAERERLQLEVIEVQRQALQDLSTPIIPLMEDIIVMPLIGNIDSTRARNITRTLLAGIRTHQAKVAILDITGVDIVDTGVANYLNKTIKAARLKGARTIITGISEAVAETIVDLGIDWGGIDTLSDLQSGLVAALNSLGIKLTPMHGSGNKSDGGRNKL